MATQSDLILFGATERLRLPQARPFELAEKVDQQQAPDEQGSENGRCAGYAFATSISAQIPAARVVDYRMAKTKKPNSSTPSLSSRRRSLAAGQRGFDKEERTSPVVWWSYG